MKIAGLIFLPQFIKYHFIVYQILFHLARYSVISFGGWDWQIATSLTKFGCSQDAIVRASCKIDAFGSFKVLIATFTLTSLAPSFFLSGIQVPRWTVPKAPVPNSACASSSLSWTKSNYYGLKIQKMTHQRQFNSQAVEWSPWRPSVVKSIFRTSYIPI